MFNKKYIIITTTTIPSYIQEDPECNASNRLAVPIDCEYNIPDVPGTYNIIIMFLRKPARTAAVGRSTITSVIGL